MRRLGRRTAASLGLFLLLTSVLLVTGCSSDDRFADDPINWSFVSGDGSWDSNSRKWVVYLSPGETKTITIQLYNSGSERNVVNVEMVGPPDSIGLQGAGRYPVPAENSINITLSATAYKMAARGSHKYVVDCGYSFNMGPTWR